MPSNIVQFPIARSDGEMTKEDWDQLLIGLHGRLQDALQNNQRIPNRIRIVLSIDDVFEIGRLIEQEVGPEHFSDEGEGLD